MTRFMMSLADSVSLVDFAWKNASQGDLFIRKAAACSVSTLAQAVINLFKADVGIDIIGPRHGEKLSESLASHEELARADDMGEYFRIHADARDLNYSLYVEQGDQARLTFDDYDSSHAAVQMSVEDVERLLLTLPEVRAELEALGTEFRKGV